MASQYVDPKKKNKRRAQKLSARISIAVVDPNFSYAEPLCRRIRLAGHRCHRFRTGRNLILALDNHRFDAFILEWQLPDLSALEVLRRIRAMCESSAAVLFISARANEDHVVMALRHGADDYMVKPLRFWESVARLERILVR